MTLKEIPPRAPAWWLDAMREGCAKTTWEDSTRWQRIVARIRYFFRD